MADQKEPNDKEVIVEELEEEWIDTDQQEGNAVSQVVRGR